MGLTREEVVSQLKDIVIKDEGDAENQHWEADHLVINFIKDLGYEDIAEAWYDVPKWYA